MQGNTDTSIDDVSSRDHRTPATPLPSNVPRPVLSEEDMYAHIAYENVISVVENDAEKLNLLRTALGQSIVSQQALSASGSHSHRVILFIVDDTHSIGQYATELENMDFQVGSYTVAMHTSGVNQWPNIIYNDIVVVAANMLLDSLGDGSIKLSQAHLLVISDAQRVVPMVTPHPVLRMISEFYNKMLKPPRILAMLTTSTDRWASLDVSRLETPFRAQAFFLTAKSVDSSLSPMELVVEYDAYDPAWPAHPLSTELRQADPDGSLLRRWHYRRATAVFQQLGSFAAYLYWRKALDTISRDPEPGDNKSNVIQESLDSLKARSAPETLDATTDSPGCNVTPKLDKLLQVLSLCTSYGDLFRGIIHVRDKVVAETLADLLRLPDVRLHSVRPIAMSGSIFSDNHRQKEFLAAFASGTNNLLILTKSYEDIDIRGICITINFDLYDDQLSYAYSHFRCRGRHAHTIHMVERGNNEQRRVLATLQTVDGDLRTWIATCGDDDLPPKSMRISLDPYRSENEDDDEGDPDNAYIVDAATSARIYKSDAVPAIYRFVAQLQALLADDGEETTFSVEERSGENSEVSYRSKWEARREVCFQACRELVQFGLMDHRHFPQARQCSVDLRGSSGKGDDAMPAQDVKTANTSAKTRGYPRKLPDFWPNSQSSLSTTTLHPTIVAPDNMGEETHAPVLLLTRAPLPPTPEFALFYSGMRTTAHFFKAAPFEITDAQLRALHGYTLRIIKSFTNKPLEYPLGSLLCYFAPLDSSWPSTWSESWPLLSIERHIPWDAVQLAADYYAIPLVDSNTSLDDRAKDAIVLDRQVEFTMRHFIVKVRHDLTPLSKVEDSPREADYSNFLEYCRARRKDFQGLDDEKQPMIEVNAISGVINNLHPTSAAPAPSGTTRKAPLKYLIPELCYKFTIPASVFRTLWLMPSIMNKIDSYLLVKELNARLFQNLVLEQQLLIALSAPAAWTEVNYERLEFLGDSFLKVMASNFCYATLPSGDAGDLHAARQSIISNKVLQEGAARVGVPSYIQHKRFVAKLWQPPVVTPSPSETHNTEDADGDVQMVSAEGVQGTKNKGKRSKKQRQLDEQNTLWMGDKIIADVVEAILAASFLSGGHEVALQTARQLQIPIPNVAQWSDYARLTAQHAATAKPAPQSTIPPRSTIEAIEQTVFATFSRADLLGQALTHTSTFSGSEGISYDRLEFIGDAILDFLVCRFIWERHPYLSPGGLTMLKAAMVSNQTLAAFCVHIGLHKHLLLQSKDLSAAIQKYIDFLEELQKKEYDFATREQRLPGQYWLDMPMEPPKCLSDMVESLIGALYVCDNFFEVGVGRFFEGVFKPFLEAHVRLQTLSTNPKITLLELLQAEGCQDIAVVKQPAARQNMPVHMDVVIHGKVIASAMDASAAIATRKVSLAALDVLANNPELLARTCDCRSAVSSAVSGKGSTSDLPPLRRGSLAEDEETEAAEVEAAMEAEPHEE